MKRIFLLVSLASLLGFFAHGQTTSPEVEEKVTRLSADMDRLLSINADLQKQISSLKEELAQVQNAAVRKPNDDSALQGIREDIKKLAEKIQEVDKKRLADKDGVAELLEKIRKDVIKSASAANARPAVSADKPEKGYEYVVQSGDTLSGIVAACNVQFKEQGMKTITTAKVQEANPGLKPERMQVGQKIFIPKP